MSLRIDQLTLHLPKETEQRPATKPAGSKQQPVSGVPVGLNGQPIARLGDGGSGSSVAPIGGEQQMEEFGSSGAGAPSTITTLSLAASNAASSQVTLPDATQASQLVGQTLSSMQSSPAQALAAQSSLSSSDVASLLSE
jgi:hypothetical protein